MICSPRSCILDSPPPLLCTVLAGPVNLTAALKGALISFAQAGGHVLVAAGVAGPGDADLTGVQISPELRVGRAWVWTGSPPAPPEPPVAEPFRYTPATNGYGGCVAESNCTVLAWTAGRGGLPGPQALATQRSVGAGLVTTCLIPWFLDGPATGLSGLAKRLVDLMVSPTQPISVSGPWPVDFLAADDASLSGRYTVSRTRSFFCLCDFKQFARFPGAGCREQ